MVVKEEVQVEAEAWDHVYNHIKPTAVVAATELEIPDILEKYNRPMSLSEISAAAGCLPHLLYRLMRFLIFHGIFKKVDPPPNAATSSVYYAQTPLSRLFAKDKLGAFMILQGSPVSRTPAGLTGEAIKTGIPDCLKSIAGEADESSLCHMKAFTDAMTAHSRSTMGAIINNYPTAFDGIQSVVHVGGRHGMALGDLVQAFPHVRGISLDLPEVVADALPRKGVEFVGGSMFESIPKADAVLLMWVLHDWSDEDCIKILKKCKEAIPANTGKVMILEGIVDEDGERDEYTGVRLSLDMVMMAITAQGKERTYKEWVHLLNEAGFTTHNVTNIKTIQFLIEAYP